MVVSSRHRNTRGGVITAENTPTSYGEKYTHKYRNNKAVQALRLVRLSLDFCYGGFLQIWKHIQSFLSQKIAIGYTVSVPYHACCVIIILTAK